MADAFENLVHEHYQSVYRFAYSLCCQYADAWDLTQQSFCIAQSRLQQLRDATKGRQWLFTITHREFLRMRRRDSSRNKHALELAEEETLIHEDHAARIDAQTMLLTFEKLEEHFRVPLGLFYFDQLSYKEIADVLDVPIGTVMSRLARAKTLLKSELAKQESNGSEGCGPQFTVLTERRREANNG